MGKPSSVERLGTEKIGALLWEMSSQTTFSLLVYAIYSLTDTYFLSVGVNALAAAGASIIAPVLIGLGAVATTVGAGGASVVSRALGEQQVEKASRTVATTYLIFWVAALTITVVGAAFIEPMVYLLGATDSIAPYAIAYGRIIFLGAITSTGFSTIIRADGSARYATAIWIIPVTANIVLCWLFIMVVKLGVAGAALATVFAQAISAGMGVYFFFFRKNRSYRASARARLSTGRRAPDHRSGISVGRAARRGIAADARGHAPGQAAGTAPRRSPVLCDGDLDCGGKLGAAPVHRLRHLFAAPPERSRDALAARGR